MSAKIKAAKAQLLKYALTKPDATLEHPWGENVAKVRGKVFVFFGMADPAKDAPYADYVMGVKLTNALLFAKSQPYVETMGYGLGKSGWVSVKMPKGAASMDMFKEWIDESYETVAPKRKAAVSSSERTGRGRAAKRRAPARPSTSRKSGR